LKIGFDRRQFLAGSAGALLRVDYDAGHGIGSTRSQQDQESADTYAFLLWQLRG
jgi:prolyl oligopeptidase